MDNQETLVTLGTQDIGRRQTKQSTTEITKKDWLIDTFLTH
jgi:hypothetical protein